MTGDGAGGAHDPLSGPRRWYVVGIGAFLAIQALLSLRWGIEQDAPVFLYAGFLMDEGHRVPYRDIFELNAPGILFFNQWLFHLIGSSDLWFRVADLAILAALVVTTRAYLVQLTDPVSAWIGPCLFAVTYLSHGYYQSMQREYLALVCLAAALLVAFRAPPHRFYLRELCAGGALGAALCFRPQLALLAPIIALGRSFASDRSEGSASGRIRRGAFAVGAMAAGAGGVVGAMALYLGRLGALTPFLEIASRYWPLYVQLDGGAVARNVVAEQLRSGNYQDLFAWPRIFTFFGLFPLGLLGCLLAPARVRAEAVERVMVLTLAAASLFVMFVGNKYWYYHAFPLFFFMSLMCGFALRPLSQDAREAGRGVWARWAIVTALTVSTLPWGGVIGDARALMRSEPFVAKGGDVDRIESFLREKLRPGDRVVPLEVSDGAVHGMLRARAQLGGSFLYDYHFYHHCDDPYIGHLRSRFLKEMAESAPRFVIRYKDQWTPSGPRSCQEFPELERLLRDSYSVAVDSPRFFIFERRS